MPQALSRLWRTYGATTLAQALTFTALLLPVLTGDAAMVMIATLPIALGLVSSRLLTFGFHVVYLREATNRKLGIFMNSLWGVIVGTIVIYTAGSALASKWEAVGVTLQLTATAAFGQSLYVIGTTMLIDGKNIARYGRFRLVYGGLSLILTALAVSVVEDLRALLWATAAATAIAGILAISLSRQQLSTNRPLLQSLSFSPTSARASITASIASATSDVGAQAGAFALPFMGEYGPLWAAMFRISGGFSTVAQQVVAPPFEMKIVEGISQNNWQSVRRTVWRSVSIGALLGAAAVLLQWSTFGLVDDPTYSTEHAASAMAFVSIFTIATVGISTTLRAPLLLTRDRSYMTVQAIRLAALAVVIATFKGLVLIAGVAAVQVAVCFALIALSIPYTNAKATKRGIT